MKSPIDAVIYSEGRDVDRLLQRVVVLATERGLRSAGFIQIDAPRPGRTRCDMRLHSLLTGEAVAISEDRGPGARGCRLDADELLRATTLARKDLASRPDLLVINKFGKVEAEGGGFRSLIAEAVDFGVPVLIGVPWRNIDPWRSFAGDLAREWPLAELARLAEGDLCSTLGLAGGAGATDVDRVTPLPGV